MSEDRYTAEEIEAELYDGMPGDREFVPASDYDAIAAELEAVKGTDHYQRSLDEMHLRYNVEAELEAVNAELARVKAESLRVVKVGGPTEYWRKPRGFALVDGRLFGKSPGFPRNFDICQPVRLERWEAEG